MATSGYILSADSARKLKRLFAGSSVAGSLDAMGGGTIDDADFRPPFTVSWAQSVGESGSWIIWLPEKLVMYGAAYVDPREGLSAAQGDYPDGWYIVPSLQSSGGTVWLRVMTDESPVSASIGTQEEDDAVNVKLALCALNSSTGARTVKQFVSSSVTISDGTVPVAEKPSPFRIATVTDQQTQVSTRKIVDGRFYFDGALTTVADFDLTNIGSNSVYLVGTKVSQAWQWIMQSTAPSSQDGVSVKLYDFANGSVSMDYRTTFLTLSSGGGDISFVGTDDTTGTGTNFRIKAGDNTALTSTVTTAQDGTVEIALTLRYV